LVRKCCHTNLSISLHTFAKPINFNVLPGCGFPTKYGARNAHFELYGASYFEASRKTGNMSCRDTIHLICWYLEHRLSPNVEDEISAHLSSCADCRLVLEAATHTLDRYFGSGLTGESATASRAA